MKISNSRIQCFKSCRRLYEFKYIHRLFPKVEKSEALQTGSSYHDKVRQINETGDFVRDENAKTNAMARAYQKFILPKIGGKIVEAEKYWEDRYGGDTYCGIFDAVREDGVPIEFKTTSGAIDGSYWTGLENDEQILMYMMATWKFEIVYCVIQVPTIRQKKDETLEEFEERCFEWFDETKAQVEKIVRPVERILQFMNMLSVVETEIEMAEKAYKNKCSFFYPNPNNCRKWGRLCEYAPICNSYDPKKEYIDFEVRQDEKADDACEGT